MKANVTERLEQIADSWNPRIVGELNEGEFIHRPVAREETHLMMFVAAGGAGRDYREMKPSPRLSERMGRRFVQKVYRDTRR